MRILAVDPGFGRCGVAILDCAGASATLVHSACIETSSESSFPDRLAHVADEVATLIRQHKPEALALEALLFSVNRKTAMQVAEARGVIICEAARAGMPVFEYAPVAIKTAVAGYGQAPKTQVETMVRKLVALGNSKRLDDEIDAIAVGLTHAATARFEV